MNSIPRRSESGDKFCDPSAPSDSGGVDFGRRCDLSTPPMKRKSRARVVAAVRRLDLNDYITPPRCSTPPRTPPSRCIITPRTPPRCIAPTRKPTRRLFEENESVKGNRRIIEEFPAVNWNSRAISNYFSNPAPIYMR